MTDLMGEDARQLVWRGVADEATQDDDAVPGKGEGVEFSPVENVHLDRTVMPLSGGQARGQALQRRSRQRIGADRVLFGEPGDIAGAERRQRAVLPSKYRARIWAKG